MASALSWKCVTSTESCARKSDMVKHSAFRAGKTRSQSSGSYSVWSAMKIWTGRLETRRSMRMLTMAGAKYAPPATVTMPVPENRSADTLFRSES